MAEGTTVNCEPCGYDGLSKSAHLWCNDCEEGFCDECVKDHKRTKILRCHHLISITDYLKSAELFFDENCEHHKEPFEFFCSQHDSILCLNCFQEHHSKCKISKLSEVAKGSKTSTALTDLENEIQSTSQNFAEYNEDEDKSNTDLKQQEQNIRDEVYNIRRKINNHLDQLQENILRDLEMKYNNCTKNVNEYFSAFKVKRDDIKALHNRISNMKMYASEKQVFIGIRQIGNILYKQKQEVGTNSLKQTKLSLELKTNDDEKSLLLDLKSFGDVVVRKSSETVTFIDPSKKQAQLNVQKHDSIDKINLQLHHSLNINNYLSKTMSLTACAFLSSKKVVLVDNENRRLIVHNEDGSFSVDFKLEDVFDLTPVGRSKIAVGVTKGVMIVDIDTKEVKRTNTDSGKAKWGICYGNGKLYIVSYGEIRIVDLDGTVSKCIPLQISVVFNVAVRNDNIYYINTDTETLHVIDHSGNKLWTFHDIRLKRPTCFRSQFSISLDIDNHGNVFIVLPDYDQVIVVSSDGQQHRVILDKSNNLKGPSGISYCQETHQLLVCNVSDGGASIYDIKS
ncbi:uncharacterized protein LOC127701055 [Mytilus californianus]|uniref:uncharacterized protein LOC127701055 n=1 Tax=Mytilus californianus TaxID=6549 RepID=UPI002245496F|nr:uncharacterized protein LOC127701055 [Mytilus californianus]XP_052060798.1 uncharacterized protein LOC127701055 [Mytilus californianus]